MRFPLLGLPDDRTVATLHRLALILCFLLLGLQLASTAAPIVGEHHWRQADTFSVARNFHTVSGDFFRPRIDWNHGRSGIMGMEAPIYPYLAHLAMYPLGEGPFAARLVTWLLFVVGALAGFRMMRAAAGDSLAVGFAIMLAFSPLLLFEGRQIKPDGPAWALLVVAAAAFHSFGTTRRKRTFALALLAYTASVLMKSPALLVAPAMWLLSLAARSIGWRTALARGLWFAIPVLAWWGWSAWAKHLDSTYAAGLSYFAFRVDWAEMGRSLTNVEAWVRVLRYVVSGYAVSWVLLPAVVVGALLSIRREHRRLSAAFWAWGLAGLIFVLFFGPRIVYHMYYLAPFTPPLLYFGALSWLHLFRSMAQRQRPAWHEGWLFYLLVLLFLAALALRGSWGSASGLVGGPGRTPHPGWVSGTGVLVALGIVAVAAACASAGRLWRRRVLTGLVVAGSLAVVARGGSDLVLVFTHRARFSAWGSFERDWRRLRETIACYSDPADLVATSGRNPWHLYLAARRGFSDVAETIERRGAAWYRARSVRLFVHFPSGDRRPRSWKKPLATDRTWSVYCAQPTGCPRLASCRPGRDSR